MYAIRSYYESAVLTPSDFSFPHDATLAETTPNTEMLLITDLELDKLKRLRHQGGVRNYKDRRHDLYRVEWIENDRPDRITSYNVCYTKLLRKGMPRPSTPSSNAACNRVAALIW